MEKLKDILGGFGIVLYYIISIAVAIIPVAAIGFDWWLSFIIFFVMTLIPYVNIIFWIWAIVVVFNGTHHLNGVGYTLFWIVFVLFLLQTVMNMISSFSDR